MLQKNPLQPPRPPTPQQQVPIPRVARRKTAFVSAGDFDATGILTGTDPCESLYWWMPELYGPETLAAGRPAARASQALAARLRASDQAARNTPSRPTAAA